MLTVADALALANDEEVGVAGLRVRFDGGTLFVGSRGSPEFGHPGETLEFHLGPDLDRLAAIIDEVRALAR